MELASIEEVQVGGEVFWVDPDASWSSGYYTVDAILTDEPLHADTLMVISQPGGSSAEVFLHELRSVEPQIIVSASEAGAWSNEAGWGELAGATEFAPGEVVSLPDSAGHDACVRGLCGARDLLAEAMD